MKAWAMTENQMTLKVEQGVRLTKEQVIEIGESIMSKPDMGWNYDDGKHLIVQDFHLDGEYGEYWYRVNTAWNLITLQKVKG